MTEVVLLAMIIEKIMISNLDYFDDERNALLFSCMCMPLNVKTP